MFQSVSMLETPYGQLTSRVYRQVNSSAAQQRRQTVITRQAGERKADWDCLLEHLESQESVRLKRLDGDAAQLNWTNHHIG